MARWIPKERSSKEIHVPHRGRLVVNSWSDPGWELVIEVDAMDLANAVPDADVSQGKTDLFKAWDEVLTPDPGLSATRH